MGLWAASETGTAGCKQLCGDGGDGGILGGVQCVHGRLRGPSIVKDDEAERRGTLMKSARRQQASIDVGSRGSK